MKCRHPELEISVFVFQTGVLSDHCHSSNPGCADIGDWAERLRTLNAGLKVVNYLSRYPNKRLARGQNHTSRPLSRKWVHDQIPQTIAIFGSKGQTSPPTAESISPSAGWDRGRLIGIDRRQEVSGGGATYDDAAGDLQHDGTFLDMGVPVITPCRHD